MINKYLVAISLLLLPVIADAAVAVTVTPTGDNVLVGGVRTVYSYVTGATDNSVTWTASGGSKVDNTGFTVWTAPTAGTYTVTATSVEDNTATASATLTVWDNATVRLSNIPKQATIFKNQPIVIQAIIWGTTNTAVTWDNSGGTLTGTGREVVFSASAAGTYTITSTSDADGSKTDNTTIVVSDNAWSGNATPNHTMPIDCYHSGSGTEYNVTSEATMDEVPWSTLGPGDTVRIHPDVVYHKQILISTSGSATQPIRICGVPADNGALPELSGVNATADAGGEWGTGLGNLQGYAGIMIYNYGGAYYGGPIYPKYIIIEGLKLSGYHSSNTYTSVETDNVTSYVAGAACIRVQRGGYITIRGNDISGCGNGIFSMSNNSVESQSTRSLLVEGNYFSGNGVSGSYLEHQNYLQAFGLVVQGNYYAANLSGAQGGQLKARAVQQFVRYNYFEPAARMIDLVEEQDANGMVFPWYGIDANELVNTSLGDVVSNLEAYQDPFVYGNILNNHGATSTGWMVHGAADTGDQKYNYGGTLYFYHNTIYDAVPSNVSYRSGLFDFGPYQYAVSEHTVWPTARVTNNAIYLDEDVSPSLTTFFLNRYRPDRVALDKNWISTAWGTGNTAGGDGTGIASANPQNAATNVWQMGTINTQVYGVGSLVGDATLPFDNTTYIPISDGALIGASASLPGKAADLPPLMQYNPSTYLMTQRTATTDIGAVQYSEAGADTTPSAFSFTDNTGVALSTVTYSTSITVAGIDNVTTLSLTGTGCEYSINGAEFATADDNVSLNNNVALRVTSSGSYSTAVSCTLNLGGVTDTWSVTTMAAVLDPVAPRMRAGSTTGGWR